MKLSRREKTLLAVLLLLGISYLYYTYLLTPQLLKVNATKELLNQKQRDLSYAKLEASPENKIYEEYKTLNARIANTTKAFFPVINQEKIILILEDMIDASNLKVPVITFTEPGLEKPLEQTAGSENKDTDPILQTIIDEVKGKKSTDNTNINQTPELQEQGYQLKHMNVTVAFKGTYFNILSFLDKIESFEKKIIIKSLNITTTENGTLNGSVSLDFYSVPKLHQQDEDYLRWDIMNGYGKENPFGKGTRSTGSLSEVQTSSSDFTLVVSPIMSDLPSVVIGKTVDNRGDTQIYADNSAKEAVEIQVFQSKGKYFYRYKTSNESYPKDYNNESIEFEPKNGQIKMQVVSVPRTGAQDKNGVAISIINKTDLDFITNIVNDDPTDTRFNIVNSTGKVIINR